MRELGMENILENLANYIGMRRCLFEDGVLHLSLNKIETVDWALEMLASSLEEGEDDTEKLNHPLRKRDSRVSSLDDCIANTNFIL